jgi:hypothetical protein
LSEAERADARAWQALRPLLDRGEYLPWSEWALRPAALARVTNEVALREPREIVELGAGVSTVVLARLLRERGGRLTSLEHDAGWAAWVTNQLDREGLSDFARVVHAPLEPAEPPPQHRTSPDPPYEGSRGTFGGGGGWYAPAAVATLPNGVELLVVDGPPAGEPELAQSRYPALPRLEPLLAPGALVFLDDAERDGERAVLERWERELPAWRFALDAAARARSSSACTVSVWSGISSRCSRIGIASSGRPASRRAWPRL